MYYILSSDTSKSKGAIMDSKIEMLESKLAEARSRLLPPDHASGIREPVSQRLAADGGGLKVNPVVYWVLSFFFAMPIMAGCWMLLLLVSIVFAPMLLIPIDDLYQEGKTSSAIFMLIGEVGCMSAAALWMMADDAYDAAPGDDKYSHFLFVQFIGILQFALFANMFS